MMTVTIDTAAPEKPNYSIDPNSVSDGAYMRGCRIINAYIRRYLRDPEKRAEFEKWKVERSKTDDNEGNA